MASGRRIHLRAHVFEQFAEGTAGDKLHDDKEVTLGMAKVKDLDNAAVVEFGGGAGFLEEAVAEVRAPGDVGVHDLEGDVTQQGDVVGLKDGAHAPLAQEAIEPVALQCLTHQLVHLDPLPRSANDSIIPHLAQGTRRRFGRNAVAPRPMNSGQARPGS